MILSPLMDWIIFSMLHVGLYEHIKALSIDASIRYFCVAILRLHDLEYLVDGK